MSDREVQATLFVYTDVGIYVKKWTTLSMPWVDDIGVEEEMIASVPKRPGAKVLNGRRKTPNGHTHVTTTSTQKREGDFSCETSPPRFRFSEIRFGFRITTLVLLESLGTHELSLACSSLFSDHCRRKHFLAAIHFQLPGPSLVADSRR